MTDLFRLIRRGPWLWALLVLPRLAAAQCNNVNTPDPACPVPFRAVDVATNQEVNAFCVGRAVRFEINCNRQVDLALLAYNAVPGVNQTPPNCNFTPGRLPNNSYTPTAVGPVTISELANPPVGGGTGNATIYLRNFQVFGTPAPAFTVAPCPSGYALVTVTDNSAYDGYTVQAGNGTPLPIVRNVPLAVPLNGAGNVTVAGIYTQNGLCTGSNTQAVASVALPPTPPAFTRLTLQSPTGPAAFEFNAGTLPANFIYDLQRDDGSTAGFRRVGRVAPGSATYALANPGEGQFRLARRDTCGVSNVAPSNVLPTVVLSVSSLNNANNLSWQTAGPVSGYVLLRDGVRRRSLPASATSFADDSAVVCGTRYAYRLRALVGGAESVSNPVDVLTVSGLKPGTPQLVASFDLRNRVELSASLPAGAPFPAGGTLRVRRQLRGQAPADFRTLTAAGAALPVSLLRDSTNLAELQAAPPCYSARFADVCTNASDESATTCPALLWAEAADADGQTVRLRWTDFQGPGSPAQPASYRLLTVAADGSVLAATPVAAPPYLDLNPPADRQVLRYRLEASGAGLPAGAVSYSNVASVARRPRLVVPTAFTPNGDGLNDVLELKGRYLDNFTFVVVDRNGQEVFRATNRTQTWDGTVNGRAPVNGAYAWRLELREETGRTFTQNGSVTILK